MPTVAPVPPKGIDAATPTKPDQRAWLALLWVGIVAFICYSTASVLRYLFFGTGADLTIFFQALSTRESVPFETLIKGPGDSIFGDHFHPIILLVWPLMTLLPHPITLLVVQSFCLALAVAMLVGHYRQSHGGGVAFALVVALSPGVQGAAIFDFHEVCLGAPIMVGWLIALRRRHLWTASLCAAALLLVKEDLALWVRWRPFGRSPMGPGWLPTRV